MCTFPTFLNPFITWVETSMLASRLAVCDKSNSTDATSSSLFSKLTPPTKSDEFSFSANHLAASLLAPFLLKTYTEDPLTLGSRKASA